jgi:hypothetical protein
MNEVKKGFAHFADFLQAGEKGIVVVDKVEASGMATAINIQHTADVKEGDTIMAIGVVGEELEYLGLPTSTLDAFGIFGKVAEAPRNIILQLERPLEKVIIIPLTV